VSTDRLLKKFYKRERAHCRKPRFNWSNESKVKIELCRDRGAEAKQANRSRFYKDIITAHNAF
jgi:hypothetical protein